MKKISGIIIAIIAVLAAPVAALASPPSMPLLVSGDVTIDNSPAPVGTEISAEIKDTEIIVITKTTEKGKYCIKIPDGEINTGKSILFKVKEIIVEDKNNEYRVANVNETSRLNFDLAVSTAESEPASTSAPSGGNIGGGTPATPPKENNQEDPAPPEPPKIPIVKGATTVNIIDGDIIQCKTSDNPFAVYIVKIVGETKYIRHIVSLEIFDYYSHLKWENLKQVDSLSEYSLSGWVRVNTGLNGTPGPTDKVYEINGDQTKHWINMTAEDFLAHGGSEPAIFSVNQGELDLYATGADVMSL